MSRLYIIIPCFLLLLFGGAYWNYATHSKAEAAAQAEAAARIAKTQAEAQATAEQAAQAAAEKRAAERAAQEVRLEAERIAKWQQEKARLAADITALQSQANALNEQLATARQTLDELQAKRTELRAANLTDSLAVERLRITKEMAELELQRLISMLAQRNRASTPALALP